MEAPVGIEPTIAELQSTALPLCYGALKLSLYYFPLCLSSVNVTTV